MMPKRTADTYFRSGVQPVFGMSDVSTQSTGADLRAVVRSELGGCRAATLLTDIDIWLCRPGMFGGLHAA